MNDKWNLRLWLRNWLLRPSRAESTRINAVAQGEPKATAYGYPISASPPWIAACDGLVASDQALSAKITSVRLDPGSC